MGLMFFLFYAVVFGVPLLGSALLVAILVKTVFRGRIWRWPVAIAVVLAASCVPWLLDRIQIEQDLAAFEPDTIFPEALSLEDGALWRLEDGNHAGITCGYTCDYTALSFVTDADIEGYDYALRLNDNDFQLGQHDLWDGLFERADEDGEAFPYQYAYISMSSYLDYGVEQSGYYRKDHWPANGKGVHMLVRLPADGQLDFATADVLYRRYNIQTEAALPFFWGLGQGTAQVPSSEAIFQDLVAISAGQ